MADYLGYAGDGFNSVSSSYRARARSEWRISRLCRFYWQPSDTAAKDDKLIRQKPRHALSENTVFCWTELNHILSLLATLLAM